MTLRSSYPVMDKPKRFDPSRFQADTIQLFPALRSEPDEIVAYLRTGGCTAGCGACCEAFVIPLDPKGLEADGFAHVVNGRLNVPVDPIVIGNAGTEDWKYWLSLHDTTILELPSGVLVADLPIECEDAPDDTTLDGWYKWLEEQGVAVIQREGQQVLAYINRKCDKLSDDGLCQVFGTPERPEMCSGYPAHPADIEGLDRFCTYNFAPVERAEIMARGVMGQGQPERSKKKNKRKKRGRR